MEGADASESVARGAWDFEVAEFRMGRAMEWAAFVEDPRADAGADGDVGEVFNAESGTQAGFGERRGIDVGVDAQSCSGKGGGECLGERKSRPAGLGSGE